MKGGTHWEEVGIKSRGKNEHGERKKKGRKAECSGRKNKKEEMQNTSGISQIVRVNAEHT